MLQKNIIKLQTNATNLYSFINIYILQILEKLVIVAIRSCYFQIFLVKNDSMRHMFKSLFEFAAFYSRSFFSFDNLLDIICTFLCISYATDRSLIIIQLLLFTHIVKYQWLILMHYDIMTLKARFFYCLINFKVTSLCLKNIFYSKITAFVISFILNFNYEINSNLLTSNKNRQSAFPNKFKTQIKKLSQQKAVYKPIFKCKKRKP